jgi:GMP synthase-like glutamine amidotransferase
MRVHVLQHVPFEGLGSIAGWLETKRAVIGYTRFFEDPQLPAPDSIDALIILGGPMSVNDEDQLPWLIEEKKFIRNAVARGIPILGICLGAQMIASAMGALVYRNRDKEIGWFPVRALPAPAESLPLPKECTVFQWHGETFDLPEGAVHLAQSDGCENQAFQLNRNVVALQFHLEATIDSSSALLENCRDDIVPGSYIQDEATLRTVPASAYQNINAVMNNVLNYLFGRS